MTKAKTINPSFSGGKLQYQGPEVELYDLHTPISLLTDASESIIAIDGETENFIDGDDFY